VLTRKVFAGENRTRIGWIAISRTMPGMPQSYCLMFLNFAKTNSHVHQPVANVGSASTALWQLSYNGQSRSNLQEYLKNRALDKNCYFKLSRYRNFDPVLRSCADAIAGSRMPESKAKQ
jgi:hypothetical protein